jgi:acetyltransferase-like isoleucine patch superfamily enzyme
MKDIDEVSERHATNEARRMAGAFHRTVHMVGRPSIGENTWIGPFCLIDDKVIIGDGCDISAGTHIYSHSTVERCISGRKYDKNDHAETRIGNNTFIGANCTILKGVFIGDNCVIGAGSVVLEDTKIYSGERWAGNPARRVD